MACRISVLFYLVGGYRDGVSHYGGGVWFAGENRVVANLSGCRVSRLQTVLLLICFGNRYAHTLARYSGYQKKLTAYVLVPRIFPVTTSSRW